MDSKMKIRFSKEKKVIFRVSRTSSTRSKDSKQEQDTLDEINVDKKHISE